MDEDEEVHLGGMEAIIKEKIEEKIKTKKVIHSV
jgi:hypothetical protein